MRLYEFGQFGTFGTFDSPSSQQPQDDAGSQPWELTQKQVRGLSNDDLNEKFWKVAAERIWKQAGSKEWQKIANHYAKKYGLPAMEVSLSNKLSPSVNGEAELKDGKWSIYMSPRVKNSPYEAAIVLRHEIEHVVDHEKSKFSPDVDKPRRTKGKDGVEVTGHHHKNFDDFNTDYAHRIVVRDARRQGKKIPAEVLKDYPNLG